VRAAGSEVGPASRARSVRSLDVAIDRDGGGRRAPDLERGSAWSRFVLFQGSLAPHLVTSWNSDRGGAGTARPASPRATFVVSPATPAGHHRGVGGDRTRTAALRIESGGSLSATIW
jgi:hypothetical protein